jgi:8-oxo-dGTP diphosphatase
LPKAWRSRQMRERSTGIIVVAGRILLVRESSGMWLLPGGKIERGELPIIAVARELFEEIGSVTHAARFLFTHRSRTSLHHVFRVELSTEFPPKAREEIVAIEWFDPVKIYDIETSQATRAMLELAAVIQQEA